MSEDWNPYFQRKLKKNRVSRGQPNGTRYFFWQILLLVVIVFSVRSSFIPRIWYEVEDHYANESAAAKIAVEIDLQYHSQLLRRLSEQDQEIRRLRAIRIYVDPSSVQLASPLTDESGSGVVTTFGVTTSATLTAVEK